MMCLYRYAMVDMRTVYWANQATSAINEGIAVNIISIGLHTLPRFSQSLLFKQQLIV